METPADRSIDLVLAAINANRTTHFRLVRRYDVGSGAGAHAVELPSGERAVLKWWKSTPTERNRMHTRQQRLPALRQRGWPIPPLQDRGDVDGYLFELWGVIDGQPGVHAPISRAVADQAVALIENARGTALGNGEDWPEWLTMSIWRSIERAERESGPAGREMLEHCRVTLNATTIPPGRDIIHGDFGPANCLLGADRIVAVIDVDDCRDGDGTLDLIGLVWDLAGWEKASPDVLDSLWSLIARQAEPGYRHVLLSYWIAGTLAWAAGTEYEGDKVDLAVSTWERIGHL